MKKAFRKVTVLLLALALIAGLVACGGNTAENETTSAANENAAPDVVNIGVQTLITPELIARYEKVYEEYLGTKVNLIQFDSGADVNKAFASGSVDIAAFGSSPASIGIAGDLGYQVFWYYDVIGSAESLAVQGDAGVTDLKGLVGKKVATPFASTAHYSLLNALELEGVDPGELELLDMQPDDIYAAWKRGDIDAAYVWNPVLGELKAEGGVILTDSAQLAQKGIVTADLAAVRKDFAAQYPQVVVNYVLAQFHALEVFHNDRDAAIEAIANAAGISVEEAASQVGDFEYPDGATQITAAYLGTKGNPGELAQTLKKTADFLVSQGSIDSAPDLDAFQAGVTGEFVEEALEQYQNQ